MNKTENNKRLIILSKENWWSDLACVNLPSELVLSLRGVIGNYKGKCYQETVTSGLIKLAKEHLSEGLLIGGESFDVVVCVPKNKEEGRFFFTLIPRWQDCELKRLSEF